MNLSSEIIQLLKTIKSENFKLYLDQTNTLKLDTGKGALSKELKNQIALHRDVLIEFLQAEHGVSKIERVLEKRDYFLISSQQQRMYFLYEFEKESLAYNMPLVVKIDGILNKDKFESTFKKLINRQEVLRTSFERVNGVVVQKIHDQVDFQIEMYSLDKSDPETVIQSFIRPFELHEAPLLRVGLLELSTEAHLLMVDMHHIISDGVSQGILIKEFWTLFNDELLPDVLIHYKDYADWQQAKKHQINLQDQRNFWMLEFAETTIALDLPTDFVRPVVKSYKGANLAFTLNNEELEPLRKLSERLGSTMFMTILAIFNVLLSKLSNQENVTIGTPVTGRDHDGLDNVMGMFVNTLALRNLPKGDLSFDSFLSTVKEKILSCFYHQSFLYEELIEELKIVRETSRNPLFDVMFVYQSDEGESMTTPGLTLGRYDRDQGVAKFDLLLSATETANELLMDMEYSTDLFRKETVERFVNYFRRIVKSVLKDSSCKISEIEILSKEEKNQLLIVFNETAVDYPRNKTVLELFDIQAEKNPENIALTYCEETLTYREFQSGVNQLASKIKARGVSNGDVVALISDRSFEWVIGIYAIMKCGAAYLPIDPSHPESRMNFILKDSAASLVLVSSMYESSRSYSIDTMTLNLIRTSNHQEFEGPGPEDLAYTIYTSGSTGTPKGVKVAHKSLTNLITSMDRNYPLQNGESFLLKTNCMFDVSFTEIFGWWMNGGKLAILPKGEEADVQSILKTIQDQKVTHINFAPSVFSVFLDKLKGGNLELIQSLKYVFLAGEALPLSLVQAFNELGINAKLENIYGPTEGTVYSSSFSTELIDDQKSVPIGNPLDNVQLFILDKYQNVQPIGVPGELYIGGAGLALGYLNNDKLTSEKFVANPHKEGSKMYKTGDLARWQEDGNIEFLGRLDDQVKIRGFRIELGEIESQISKHKEVLEVIVLAKRRADDNLLVCYYIAKEELDPNELRKYMKERLPDYMVPLYYIHLNSFPISSSGKVDRKSLPDPKLVAGQNFEAPSGKVEKDLVRIWAQVLNVESSLISVNKSFFELGGHSLKAATMVNKILVELNVEITLKDVFAHQDVKSLGDFIEKLETAHHQHIPKVSIQPSYPLSSEQRRMYFLYEFDRSSVAYNMPQVVELKGLLKIDLLTEVFKKLISRHESLRTSFEMIDGEVFQKISPTVDYSINQIECQASELDSKISGFICPFDLNQPSLIRVGLLKLNAEHHLLMVDMHHIISDGVSGDILIKEFITLYNGGELPERTLQYKDYACWQQSEKQQETLAKHGSFWEQEFSEEVVVLDLPTDFPRPLVKTYSAGSLDFALSSEETKSLRSVSEYSKATMFMTTFAIFNVLLSKLSDQNDITVGTPVAGRNHPDLEDMIGIFINTLAVRTHPEGSLSFESFLQQVREKSLACFEHQSYPYEELIEKLAITRDTGRNPLFDVMFMYQNPDNASSNIPGLEITPYNSGHTVSKFDLTMTVMESADQLHFNVEYSNELFTRDTIDRFMNSFRRIMSAVIEDSTVRLSSIDILSSDERTKLLHEFNDTASNYADDKTVMDLFEAQVLVHPNRIALHYDEGTLTYSELNDKVSSLTFQLIQQGVEPGAIVGIMMDRTWGLLVSLLAVLRSGASYLPVDPSFPEERIHYMLTDSGTQYCLTQDKYSTKIDTSIQLLTLEGLEESSEKTPSNNSRPDGIAYVIYTSGSTGKPKGVKVSHSNISNFIEGITSSIEFNDDARILALTTISFDIFLLEALLPLTQGMSVVLANESAQNDPALLSDLISGEKVNMLQLTPSRLQQMLSYDTELNQLDGVKTLMIGGEAFPEQLLKTVKSKYDGLLYNMYGPTETTVWSSICDLTKAEGVTIGKPISNTTFYVLGKEEELLPLGVAGELCIGGSGVASGYLNNEELTTEKFVNNPHQPGEVIYRTGDLCRWLPDGSMDFLGRVDDQVKIRGFRIELGEVEWALSDHPEIKTAVVTAKESNGDKHLVAYYVSEEELASSTLRDHLSTKLPDYMMPGYYVHMSAFPMTANGKINRRALPDPQVTAGQDYTLPEGDIEEGLVKLWSEVLQLDSSVISTQKSFFELGGHSLKAMHLVNQISTAFEVKVTLRDIFNYQDISRLGTYIAQADDIDHQRIQKSSEKTHYVLSSGQRRMYFLYEFDKNSLAYNMPQIVELKGELDVEKLTQVFEKLIYRHECLRTSFELIDNEVFQKIDSRGSFEIETFVISSSDVSDTVENFIRPFDLNDGPLFRVSLIKLSAHHHILMVDMHHIITDGISNELLLKDFMMLYAEQEITPIHIHYKDYAEWQQSPEQQNRLEKQKAFWMQQFVEETVALNLPTDFARPMVKNYEGSYFDFSIGQKETAGLTTLSRELESTLFMSCLAIFNILLSKLSNQDDIIVGTPVAGRNHADVANMMGVFINTLTLRNFPRGNLSFTEFLLDVKDRTLAVYDNQEYQYEELVEDLNIPRETSRNPLFDVMFGFQNFDREDFSIPGLQLTPYEREQKLAKFDFGVIVIESEDQLNLRIEYSTELFKPDTVVKFARYFEKILTSVLTNPKQMISEISVLSEDEEKQLLYDFNDTQVNYEQDKTIIELFEDQVEKSPEKIALTFGKDSMTYSELNSRSNQLASKLRQQGVLPETRIGLLFNPGMEAVIGIIGALKSGGAFIPLDPDSPEERLKFQIQDSSCSVLLTSVGLLEGLSMPKHIDYFTEVDARDALQTELISNPKKVTQADDLAYIIYTSGTTGLPKGVMINHSSIFNTINFRKEEFQLGEQDEMLQLMKFSFDVFIASVFVPLVSGSSVYIASKDERANVEELAAIFRNRKITDMHCIPVLYTSLLDILTPSDTKHLKRVNVGGDAVDKNVLSKSEKKSPNSELVNGYGPTENSIMSTMFRGLSSAKKISIGQPIANTTAYILSPNNKLQPIGVPGELCVGGLGLARGYLNNQTLTSQKFVDHPYQEGNKIYKTGDMAKWRADGNIEFLGRTDDQVKIRGYRVELGEIESQMETYEKVEKSVVLTRGQQESKYLVGYYVSENEIDISLLISHLAARLPDYMLPAHYVHLQHLPLTPNGKINRRALPEPKMTAGHDYVAPSGKVEEQLVGIWSEILQIDKEMISVNKSFFDLGGNSLKILALNKKINEVLGCDLTIAQMFRFSTITGIKGLIVDGDKEMESAKAKIQDSINDADDVLAKLGY